MSKFLATTLFLISLSYTCLACDPIKDMSLEEKVGQLLMVHFHGEKANAEAATLIQQYFVGGIIYYEWANQLSSPQQVLQLSQDLQQLTKLNRIPIPLFIAVDQEGGIVSRLKQGFTDFPGNKALAMTGDAELAELCSFFIGQELQAVGVNFNLSPVVDINNNPCNPVIGLRSFGDSSEIVTRFGKSCLLGYHRAGIITSLKHFPGHGDVDMDSHTDLPIINKTKEQLTSVEFAPFASLMAYADTIMTAHIMLPNIDPVNCATLSKNILDILSLEMSFKGVIISDSLVMEGLLKNSQSYEDAAIRAINAGCDMLILGGKQLIGAHTQLEMQVDDIIKIHQSLVTAVKNGVISSKRLDEAVQKILHLKEKYQLFSERKNTQELALPVNTPEHQKLAQDIARQAVEVKQKNILSVNQLLTSKIAIFAPLSVKQSMKKTSFLKLSPEASLLFFDDSSLNEMDKVQASTLADQAEVLIFFSVNAWRRPFQLSLYKSLIEKNKPFIAIVLKDPQDKHFFSAADILLTTFSPSLPSIQAAYDQLIFLIQQSGCRKDCGS